MFTTLALAYEFLTEFLPFLMALVMFRRVRQRHGVLLSKQHDVFLCVFALYIIAVFHVTWAGTIYNAFTFRFRNLWDHINLVPFSKDMNPIVYGLNVVMCIPFGFLVSLIWRNMRKLPSVAAAGFLFSLLIELSQLLSCRGTDVDDLIMNTLGAVLGFLMYKAWDKITKSRYRLDGVATAELPTYIFAMYLGRCLLFDHLGLIQLIYG